VGGNNQLFHMESRYGQGGGNLKCPFKQREKNHENKYKLVLLILILYTYKELTFKCANNFDMLLTKCTPISAYV